MDFAAADLEDARGQLVDKVAVVRDKHHRAGVLAQRFEQHVFGAHVQVVGGLIEEQEIRRTQQHARQGIAIALAARKHADALEDLVV